MKRISKLTGPISVWMLILLFLWFGTAGFIRVNSQLDIHEDGTVHIETKMLVLKKFKKSLDIMRSNLKKKNSNIVFESVKEGEYSGYIMRTGASTDFSSIDGFIASYNGTAHSSKSEGLFSETYTIYVIFPNNEKLRAEVLRDTLVRKYPPKYQLTINLPCAADSHNADKSMNGDKTLSWNLSPAVLGQMREVKAVYTLWNKQRIIIAAVTASALAIALFSLLVAVFRSGGESDSEPSATLDQGFIDNQFKTLTNGESYSRRDAKSRY